MSNQSNAIGRAYEYACITSLYNAIKHIRDVEIVEDSAFQHTKMEWDNMNNSMQTKLRYGANAIVQTLFELEPMIIEEANDTLSLQIQQDGMGEEGDVRDLLIVRSSQNWEIGLSLKHNHFAVKHSRLSANIDFGEKWYGNKCSQEYWNKIKPIFDRLRKDKIEGKKWNEMLDKSQTVYIPLLNAFRDEVLKASVSPNVPQKLVEYLLGKFDFYKAVSIDKDESTLLYSYNLHGTLNKPSKTEKSKISLPIVLLPTRIVSLEMKPNSDNTLEMYMDNGWQFSFRIHNASTKVEPSLKFDIQIVGMPTTITLFSCKWILSKK